MNLSATYTCLVYGNELMKAFHYADIVFGNESEAMAFAQLNNLDTGDFGELVKSIAALRQIDQGARGRIAVITHGSGPTRVSDGTVVMTIPVDPIPSSEIVDTTGAGDAFVAGFLSQFIIGSSLKDCVLKGHKVAGTIIRTSGVVYPQKNTY